RSADSAPAAVVAAQALVRHDEMEAVVANAAVVEIAVRRRLRVAVRVRDAFAARELHGLARPEAPERRRPRRAARHVRVARLALLRVGDALHRRGGAAIRVVDAHLAGIAAEVAGVLRDLVPACPLRADRVAGALVIVAARRARCDGALEDARAYRVRV